MTQEQITNTILKVLTVDLIAVVAFWTNMIADERVIKSISFVGSIVLIIYTIVNIVNVILTRIDKINEKRKSKPRSRARARRREP